LVWGELLPPLGIVNFLGGLRGGCLI
jgi:hypothetical protein